MHFGLWHGPGAHVGTHAPSVLWRRTTASTGCPHWGQTYVSLSIPPRLGRTAAQRFRWYVRTTTPLPKARTESGTNSETSKPEANMGMPEPRSTG